MACCTGCGTGVGCEIGCGAFALPPPPTPFAPFGPWPPFARPTPLARPMPPGPWSPFARRPRAFAYPRTGQQDAAAYQQALGLANAIEQRTSMASAASGPTAAVVQAPGYGGVNVRSMPNAAAPIVAADATNGATVQVLESGIPTPDGEWWRIATPSGAQGFCRAVDAAGTPSLVPTTSTGQRRGDPLALPLSVQAGPHEVIVASAPMIASLPDTGVSQIPRRYRVHLTGQAFRGKVRGTQGDWVFATYTQPNGFVHRGWMNHAYVRPVVRSPLGSS